MSYPVCLVEIFGEQESFYLQGEVDPGRPYGNAPASDLIACRTEKRLSAEAPAGSFDVTLTHATDARGRTWKDRIHPQDIVVIQMMSYTGKVGLQGEGEMHTVMIGLVDAISETTGLNSRGIPQRQIRVRGRDMGKLFLNGMVTYWSFLGATMVGAPSFVDPSKFNDRPNAVVERLLEDIFEKFVRIQFRFQGVFEQFFNMLAYQLESYDTEIPAGLDYQFLGGEGSFWSFFVKVASPPFHELFVDTRRVSDLVRRSLPEAVVTVGALQDPESGVPFGAKAGSKVTSEEDRVIVKEPATEMGRDHSAPVLIMRPPPFPYRHPDPAVLGAFADTVGKSEAKFERQAWDRLTRHEVGDESRAGGLIEEELTTSDAEQFNVYLVFPKYQGLSEEQYLLKVPPLIDERKFQRYGFKLFMPTVTLLKQARVNDSTDPWIGFYHQLAWRLASWNVLNDRFTSGYQTYKLLPHVHIGERLLDRSGWRNPVGSGASDREFYIESVSHHFIQNERATTTLGLTRGLLASEYDQIERLIRSEKLIVPKHAGEIFDVWRKIVHLGTQPPS